MVVCVSACLFVCLCALQLSYYFIDRPFPLPYTGVQFANMPTHPTHAHTDSKYKRTHTHAPTHRVNILNKTCARTLQHFTQTERPRRTRVRITNLSKHIRSARVLIRITNTCSVRILNGPRIRPRPKHAAQTHANSAPHHHLTAVCSLA